MQKYFVRLLGVLAVLGVGGSVYFYNQFSNLKADPNALAKEEAEELVAMVGKLIVLPETEIPTVATVSEPEKLKDQPFFEKAKAGDKVLLYPEARKAYLYDPTLNKVLEVAPINLGTPAKKSEPAETDKNAKSEE